MSNTPSPSEKSNSIDLRQEKQKKELIKILAQSPIIQMACVKAGVARATFYRWRKDDAEFAKHVDDALYHGTLLINDMAESQLIAAVKDRNLTAIMYWLKHHHVGYKNRVEFEGTLNTIHELSDEQRMLVEKALELADISLNQYEKD